MKGTVCVYTSRQPGARKQGPVRRHSRSHHHGCSVVHEHGDSPGDAAPHNRSPRRRPPMCPRCSQQAVPTTWRLPPVRPRCGVEFGWWLPADKASAWWITDRHLGACGTVDGSLQLRDVNAQRGRPLSCDARHLGDASRRAAGPRPPDDRRPASWSPSAPH